MTEASDTQANLLRADGRAADELRTVTIERGWSTHAEGSALISFGNTKVLCTASFTNGVLEVWIPKPEERKPRRIEISGNGNGKPETLEGSASEK